MRNLPYRWFVNIAALLEKRPFHFLTVLLFCFFVASVRLLGEWALGGNSNRFLFSDMLLFTGFYWVCFFTYTFVLWLLLAQPWQRSMNVVLVGIFLGILPPLIDASVSGIGDFQYGYLWDFPDGFSPLLYNPEKKILLGESLTLWVTIFFTALYVLLRSRRLWKGVAAALLAYGVAVFNGALFPSLIKLIEKQMGLSPKNEMFLITSGYLFLTLALFFAFQPRVFKGLMIRSLHAWPFVLITFAGAAFLGPLRADVFYYGAVVFVAFLVALGQNDWNDRDADAAQGRPVYIAAADVDFLNIVGLGLAITLLLAGSLTGVLVLIILSVSFLYSYPIYHAKRFFPSNLKIEGVWGAASFMVGVVAQVEFAAFGEPAWYFLGTPKGFSLGPLSPQTLVAVALVFGGHSLIASLKDYKDREADLAAGVQTWYTLGVRRHWNVEALHRKLVAATCGALLAPFALLVWTGRFPALSLLGAIPVVGGVWVLMNAAPSSKRFALVLGAISTQLLYLVALLLLAPLQS